jgi:hypothetical protein
MTNRYPSRIARENRHFKPNVYPMYTEALDVPTLFGL